MAVDDVSPAVSAMRICSGNTALAHASSAETTSSSMEALAKMEELLRGDLKFLACY